MRGFEYTIPARPTRRFKSQLELRWYQYLKPLASYIDYELFKVRPTTPTWTWPEHNEAKVYISDFFLKLPFDPTYHVTEIKPVSDLADFSDYLPKPRHSSHRLYLLGEGGKRAKGAPGPIWLWTSDRWVLTNAL